MCIHYSPMGKREKDQGQQHVTHTCFYRETKKSKTQCLIIENVSEYSEQLVQRELGSDWKIMSARMDPRCFGLPCCRTRLFMICYRWKEVRWVAPFSLGVFLTCLLRRVVMTAADYFYKDLPPSQLSPSAVP